MYKMCEWMYTSLTTLFKVIGATGWKGMRLSLNKFSK